MNSLVLSALVLLGAVCWVEAASEPYRPYGFEQPAGQKEYALLTPLSSEIRAAVNRYREGSPITRFGVITYRERPMGGGKQYLFKLQINQEYGSNDIWGVRVFEPNQGRPMFQALFGPIEGYNGKLNDPEGPPGM